MTQTQLNHPVRVSLEVGGRTLTLETGRMAKQADGAIFATYGETSVLATAQSAAARPDISFFPLTVEYREKTYAAGKVPGGFFKREMRPRDHEILVSRSIDRPVRPMFPEGYRDELQLIITTMSYDRMNEPDTLAACAAMAALSISSIPYLGPGATVRVGRVDGEFVINPTVEQMAVSDLDLLMSGTADAVTMVEAGAMELPDDTMVDAIFFGHDAIKQICATIQGLVDQVGKPKQDVTPPAPNPFSERVEEYRDAVIEANRTEGKHAKKLALKAVEREAFEVLTGDIEDDGERAAARAQVGAAFHDLEGDVERRQVVERGTRADGRKTDEIRPIEIELGVLGRTHGSALFTRGETQALVSVTLGTARDEQIVDGLGEEYSKRFMLHYNFPPYCVGEVRRMMGTSRREVGHGNLAERAVNMMMPTPEDFPYSARVVSEILESNGSSSMASVCGASLSLLDAGCPLRSPVAGIAMGLIKDGDQHFILSDILGSEDHNGDMDFKVAGTAEGVTALQMDIKLKGLDADVLRRAMAQAKAGRQHILGKMRDAIAEARPEVSKYAPRLIMRQIPVDKIGFLIGPGGKMIRQLQTDFNVRIEVDDEGAVTIAGGPDSDLEGAVAAVEAVTGDAEVGATYKGKVVSIREFGAFVEIFPGKEGLLHISQMGEEFVKDVNDVLDVGDDCTVKVLSIDEMGRVRLAWEKAAEESKIARGIEPSSGGGGDKGGRSGDGGGRRRDSGPRERTKPTELPEVGQVYKGPVKAIREYGAFVEVLPGVEGLLHVTEMRAEGGPRIDPEDVVSVGDEVEVLVLDMESPERIRLSMNLDTSRVVTAGAGVGEDGGDGGGRPRRGGGRRRPQRGAGSSD